MLINCKYLGRKSVIPIPELFVWGMMIILFPIQPHNAETTNNLACYICSDNRPDSKCQTDPENVEVGPKRLNCNRVYCYTQWNYINNVVTFVSRGCENKDFGNKCVQDNDGQQLVCYHTCNNWDLCNGVTEISPRNNFTIFDTENRILSTPDYPLTITTIGTTKLMETKTTSIISTASTPIEILKSEGNKSMASFDHVTGNLVLNGTQMTGEEEKSQTTTNLISKKSNFTETKSTTTTLNRTKQIIKTTAVIRKNHNRKGNIHRQPSKIGNGGSHHHASAFTILTLLYYYLCIIYY